jgi:DNA/RNA endonuclease G (NUC1)
MIIICGNHITWFILWFGSFYMCPGLSCFVCKRFARNVFLVLIGAAALFAAPPRARAFIDATLQMQLGNPSGATPDPGNHSHYLIQRTVEAIDYSDTLGEPNWTSWDLTAGDIGSSGRSPNFFTDTTLPAGFYEVTTSDYTGSGFDRGHMCPSADRTDNVTDNDLVFYLSNIIPQAANNNQGVWANFENYCRTLAQSGNELLIICGPSGFGANRIPSGKVVIPDYTWKIAVVVPPGTGTALSRIATSTRVIALKIPNNNSVSSAWQNYVTSASQIEVDTGFTFFTALPADVATLLRNKVDGQSGPPPVIAGFSPPTGGVGDAVVITGTNFTSASTVTFNGASAAFSVNSSTQITATVPGNAGSGLISVTTPNGTALSSSSFIVTGSTVDLAITKTHGNNFTQGDTADTYTITVANIGALTSTGAVTVVDSLPAGLAATDISGTGWTADLNTLVCTRSDALAAGASYPLITVTVAVATNAPLSLTNIANVSGGGDANPANNTANDATTINAGGASGNSNTVTLAGWNVSGLPGGVNNFGLSPLAPTTNAANLTVVGLTRGAGVGTTGTGAGRAWGGNTFSDSGSAAAIAAGHFITFSVTAGTGYMVSCASISKFDYRHSATGPVNGLLQYQIGSGAFTDIGTVSYPVNTSAGGSLGPINLSGIPALQNIGAGTNVTFRIVNWGGTTSAGTWYVFDVSNSPALDFAVEGAVTPVVILTPIESWRQQWFGTTKDSGKAADTYVGASNGMPNLLAYALGLNPLIATANPLTGEISTGYLRLTVPRNPNATDVTFLVEVTHDLTASWTTNGTTLDQNTPTLLQVHDNTPVSASADGFIRLRVTRP